MLIPPDWHTFPTSCVSHLVGLWPAPLPIAVVNSGKFWKTGTTARMVEGPERESAMAVPAKYPHSHCRLDGIDRNKATERIDCRVQRGLLLKIKTRDGDGCTGFIAVADGMGNANDPSCAPESRTLRPARVATMRRSRLALESSSTPLAPRARNGAGTPQVPVPSKAGAHTGPWGTPPAPPAPSLST